MPQVSCAVDECSSCTYGINQWRKEPCLEYRGKNVVKGQCPICGRPYSLCCFPAEMTKGKERGRCMDSGSQKIQTEQNGPQNAVIRFVHYIL